MYKPLQIYAPPKQSKNGKFTFNYKANLIDSETQISLSR